VHARQVRANPSGVLAEALKATADNRFPQAEQVFLTIISSVTVSRLRVRSPTRAQRTRDDSLYHGYATSIECRLQNARPLGDVA
jgi:hypothetical protein